MKTQRDETDRALVERVGEIERKAEEEGERKAEEEGERKVEEEGERKVEEEGERERERLHLKVNSIRQTIPCLKEGVLAHTVSRLSKCQG